MNRSAEFKVAAKSNCEIIKSALLLVYGHKIGEGLGGVIVTSVAGVYDGHKGMLCRNNGSALFWMRMAMMSA